MIWYVIYNDIVNFLNFVMARLSEPLPDDIDYYDYIEY